MNYTPILMGERGLQIILEPSSSNETNATNADGLVIETDNTFTFIIGFAILILFIVLGTVASVFLCVILKKDPYLWEMERDRQLQSSDRQTATNSKERDKLEPLTENTEI